MLRAQLQRELEEGLGGHREELDRVFGSVGIQQGVAAAANVPAQACVLLAHYRRESPRGGHVVVQRSAVVTAVLEVELMRELVEDDVGAIRGIPYSVQYVTP